MITIERPLSGKKINIHDSTVSAVYYLKTRTQAAVGGYSRIEMLEQLKEKGISEANRLFAVDYSDVDWNEQARKTAYFHCIFSEGHNSLEELINFLKHRGFTDEQAEFGAKEGRILT